MFFFSIERKVINLRYQKMGCKKLTYSDFESPLKVVYNSLLTTENLHVDTFGNTKKMDVNYFPFGSQMTGRHGSSGESYKRGFNGQLMDNEIAGEGNSYTAEFWQYDPRLGRRWNQDPKPNPSISNYACFANNPIMFSDPEGDTIRLAGTKAQKYLTLWYMQKLTNDDIVLRGNLVIIKTHGTENKDKTLTSGTLLINTLIKENNTLTISVGSPGTDNYHKSLDPVKASNGVGSNSEINFDPTSDPDILTKDKKTGIVQEKKRPDEIGLAHEMIHALHSMRGDKGLQTDLDTYKYKSGANKYTTETVKKEELRTVGLKHQKLGDINENQIRKEQGAETRGGY